MTSVATLAPTVNARKGCGAAAPYIQLGGMHIPLDVRLALCLCFACVSLPLPCGSLWCPMLPHVTHPMAPARSIPTLCSTPPRSSCTCPQERMRHNEVQLAELSHKLSQLEMDKARLESKARLLEQVRWVQREGKGEALGLWVFRLGCVEGSSAVVSGSDSHECCMHQLVPLVRSVQVVSCGA